MHRIRCNCLCGVFISTRILLLVVIGRMTITEDFFPLPYVLSSVLNSYPWVCSFQVFIIVLNQGV